MRPAGGATAEDADIVALANKTHGETRAHLGQQVTQIQKPMHSFFALCRTGPVPALLAASKHRVVSRAVAGTPYADLPLLSVASAPWTGGFDGPDNFLFLTQGKVERRHISGLNPYANHVWAVKTTGAQLTDWLERAALIFNTLAPDTPDQMLINPHIPGFRYDSIFGLSYKIDPSKPPRFDASGRTSPGQTGRVHDIYWNNSPLQDTQEFLVATTDHRASGGGLYKVFPHEDIIIHGQIQLQQAVMEYLSEPDCNVLRTLQPWSFTGGIDRSAILLTAPEAEDYLDDIADLKPQACGLSDDGFLRVRVTL